MSFSKLRGTSCVPAAVCCDTVVWFVRARLLLTEPAEFDETEAPNNSTETFCGSQDAGRAERLNKQLRVVGSQPCWEPTSPSLIWRSKTGSGSGFEDLHTNKLMADTLVCAEQHAAGVSLRHVLKYSPLVWTDWLRAPPAGGPAVSQPACQSASNTPTLSLLVTSGSSWTCTFCSHTQHNRNRQLVQKHKTLLRTET